MMEMLRSVAASTGFALSADSSGIAVADHINLLCSGVAVANTRAAPNVQAFTDWCNAVTGACFPTVQQPVYDTATGKQKGPVYV